MDPLSDFVERAGVRGAFFARARGRAPWAISTRGAEEAIFHVVVAGEGVVRLDDPSDGAALEHPWRRGDVIVLPRGDAHVMASAPGVPATPIRELPREIGEDGLPCVHEGEREGGEPSALLCGTFTLDPEAAEHLLPHLPRLLVARNEGALASWIDATLLLLSDTRTQGLPGASTILQRLADVLFVHVLRVWIGQRSSERGGWLRALTQPALARALTAIHREPTREWTAASLARIAGMSRSAFYSRFVADVGETPGEYIAGWRMLLARRHLRHPGAGIAEVASQVGYASEAAFSRAFKRKVGLSPGAWRSAQLSRAIEAGPA
ncbi:MAG: AraC family transcriptional regulator [Myxococcales bacterium]|nr:AraC family transcriptional regulator [Myxococcales bacterium]